MQLLKKKEKKEKKERQAYLHHISDEWKNQGKDNEESGEGEGEGALKKRFTRKANYFPR